MLNKKPYYLFVLLLVLVLSLTGCSSPNSSSEAAPPEKKVVNLLSCNYEDQITLQKEYLEGKFPGAEINITYMSSGGLAMKARAEGASLEADILLSLSSGYANILKNDGLLRAYSPSSEYRAEYVDPDGIVLPNGVWCGVILVNTEELARLSLPEPSSYKDLLNPIYKGHIVMASPVSSSTGYFFLLGLLNQYGPEEGWAFFDELSQNIMMFGESGSFPSSRVEMGEAAIGLAIDYEGIRLETEGKPVKVIFPEEGVPFDYDTVLLIDKGHEPNEFVLDVMQAITSPEGNAVFNNYNIFVLEGVDDRYAYPDNFQTMDMTGIADAEMKTDILAEWSRRYE